MRLRSLFSVVLVAVVLLFAPHVARSQTAGTLNCGATVENNLNAAQIALQGSDAATTRAAMVCLIQAMGTLNKTLADYETGAAKHLHAPIETDPILIGSSKPAS